MSKSTPEMISELLQTRMDIVLVFVEKTTRYLEIVREIIQGINPSEYKKVSDDLNVLKNLTIEIPLIEIKEVDLLDSMLVLFDKLTDIDDCFISLLALFENQTYSKMAVYNMSSTYTTNIYHERNTAILAHEKYLDTSARDDEVIFDIVFEKMDRDSENVINKALVFIMDNENVINKFTIKLIHWVISKTTGEKRRRVELVIEKQKDILLGTKRIDLQMHAGIQGTVCRYNLRPATASLPISEIFQQIGIKYNEKKSIDENFVSLALAGPGVLAINKSTPSPVEFNLTGLLDIEYITANDMKTNPLSGLTKKILERFNTTKLLPRGTPSEPVKRFTGKTSDWYIFETINGEVWRLLALHGIKIIPANAITGIIKGLTTRPHQYNVIQSEIILSKCFDSKAKMILSDYEEEKVAPPSSEPIRAVIVDKLTRGFESRISKQTVKTFSAFRELTIDYDEINEVLLDVLTHATGVYGKGSSEYLITYIAKFDGIIRAFIKELERRWGEEELPERLFKEHSGNELKKILVTIFRSVVSASVNELDRSRTWTDYDMTLKEFFLEHKQAII